MCRKNHKLKIRNPVGNIALVCAIFTAILILFGLFILDHVRFLGSNQEQVKAIEAASLAAAQDLSRIVYDDAELGLIGLSDYAPTGRGTQAEDNFYLPVISINTHLATVRLDMIIADLLNDSTMRQYAIRDYNRVMAARGRLVAELNRAIKNGQNAVDIDGNLVSPRDDAVAAYISNVVRMTGGKTRLIEPSLRLELGCVEEMVTNVAIPQPQRFARMQAEQQVNQCYKAYVNVPYNKFDFVFAGTGQSQSLIDPANFRPVISVLPYSIPCIVKCEADHEYFTTGPLGTSERRVVHAVSCASPGCAVIRPPEPGALLVSFPNGSVPELTALSMLLTNTQINKSPADVTRTPLTSDFTPCPLSPASLPVLNTVRPPMGQCLRVALYDWIRRGRSYLDVQSLLDSLNKPFSSDAAAHADHFKIATDGTVHTNAMPIDGAVTLPVSHKQWTCVSGLAFFSSNLQRYDVIAKDFVFQPGRMLGGMHAGEPLGERKLPLPVGSASQGKGIDEDPNLVETFPTGPAGGAPRDTWAGQGIAVEIRLRARS